MKKSKLSEPQIIAMLNEGETGVPIVDLVRLMPCWLLISSSIFRLSVLDTFLRAPP